MAKNYLHEGWTIAVPAPTGGVHSGDPILVGGFFGVANYDAEQTLPVEITLGGVWQLPKATTVTFGAAMYLCRNSLTRRIPESTNMSSNSLISR
jgi:predicted RecA/RadA family phage recombinase